MPMQPRPMAETLGPVVPSLRLSMILLLENRRRMFRAMMTRLIWTFSREAISWTIINSLFIISNNEGFRPPRPRCVRRRGAHPEFPPRRGRAGRLRINAPPPAIDLVLAPMVAPFLAAHPKIDLEIAGDSSFIDIVAGGFDA